jgi:hypothetical protein
MSEDRDKWSKTDDELENDENDVEAHGLGVEERDGLGVEERDNLGTEERSKFE